LLETYVAVLAAEAPSFLLRGGKPVVIPGGGTPALTTDFPSHNWII